MYRPKKIKTEESINLGIIRFKPIKDAIDVTSIGPKNQARGTLKYSAIMALGIEIIITKANFFENISLKIFFIKGYSLVIVHSL